jgi:N-acetylglucosamine kinase-like BadF-type ATPase
MIIVADSGSTKTDWILNGENGTSEKFSTTGFNPYFHDEEFILNGLEANSELALKAHEVKKVFFYGAGCSSDARRAKVKNALTKFFRNAESFVSHDVLGAILATCGNEPGITCILGTGSNSCYFDGKNIRPNNFGLGFIMGDEAGGSYFGKKLITAYLYDILPSDLRKKFESQYEMNKEIMVANVYNNQKANVWLASFAKFMTENKEHPWVLETVKAGFDEFFRLYVCCYPGYENLDLHFVGSIACHFEDILRTVAKEQKANLKKVIQSPVEELNAFVIRQQ